MNINEFIKKKLFIIIVVLIAGLLSLGVYLFIPTANKNVIDEGIYSGSHTKLVITVIILFFSFFLSEVLLALKQISLTYLENLYSLFIRINLHKKIRELKDVDSFSNSQLISYHINDVNIAKQRMRRIIDNSISYLEIISICIIVTVINYKFMIILLLLIPVYALLPKILGTKITTQSMLVQENLEKITERLTNSYKISKEIRIYQKENWDYNKTKNTLEEIIRPVVKLDFLNNLFRISNLLYSAFLCLIFYFGAILVQENKITIGTLFALTTYIGYISGPIQTLVFNYGQLKSIKVSEERLNEVLQNPNLLDNNLHSKNLEYNKIQFSNVNLSIGNHEILKDISLNIKEGEFLVITGISGSGKTSILNLIARLAKPTSGDILINNTNIDTISYSEYYSNVKYVFQDSNFIHGTLIENMFIDEHEKNKIQLLEELLLIFELDFLSNNLEFIIENGGTNLSGGQKQRLNVIRVLLCNPSILLLDEVTSGLDKEMAIKIIAYIKEMRSDKITILITHDPNIIKLINSVIYINNGRKENYEESEMKIQQ